MKYVLSFAILFFGFSQAASAAANKVCFGMEGAKGARFEAHITSNQIIISAASDRDTEYLEGAHQFRSVINGRDGVTYLEFGMPSQEGDSAMLVDQNLREVGASGQIKLRIRGEGFMQSKYFCRDSK